VARALTTFWERVQFRAARQKWYDYQMDVRSANGSRHGYAVPSGALTFLNERALDYLGLPKDRPLRFRIDTGAAWDSHISLLHPDDHEGTRLVWSTYPRTGCAGQVNFRVRNVAGVYRWFLSRAEPVQASDGILLYWIGINLEIEDRKQAEFYLAEGRLAHMGSCHLSAYLRQSKLR
jgi:PAS domain-containing protein